MIVNFHGTVYLRVAQLSENVVCNFNTSLPRKTIEVKERYTSNTWNNG